MMFKFGTLLETDSNNFLFLLIPSYPSISHLYMYNRLDLCVRDKITYISWCVQDKDIMSFMASHKWKIV